MVGGDCIFKEKGKGQVNSYIVTTTPIPLTTTTFEKIELKESNVPVVNTTTNESYIFGLDEVSFEDVAKDPEEWFSEAEKKGINIIGLEIFDLEGYTAFDSKVLKEAGFEFYSDYKNDEELFSEILTGAKKHKIKVVILIEGIAHIVENIFPYSKRIKPEKLNPKAIGDFIKELAVESRKAGVNISISEEAFNDNYIDAISKSAKENKVEYIHFFEDLKCRGDVFLSEDYSYYPFDAKNNPTDNGYMKSIINMGTYYGELGNLNVMYAAAKGCANVKYGTLTAGGWGLGQKTHQNIALMRAIQYGPKIFLYAIAEGDNGPIYKDELPYVQNYNFKKELLPLIKKFGRKESDTPKRVVNLIIDEPEKGEDIVDFFTNAYLSSMSAITNAMLASGYDIIVTRKKPYEGTKNVSLYYVFSAGKIFDDEEDIPKSLADLVENNKKVPVFYQLAGEFPDMPN